MKKPPKEGAYCYALKINVATTYISFKVEKVRYLGEMPSVRGNGYNHAIEDSFDGIDYISLDDIFTTEENAIRSLIKILQKRGKK